VRTSLTDPIEVGWLPTPWRGRVGLTFAPGKYDDYALSGPWARDLDLDLARLREHHGATRLVTLLEDHELDELRIPRLVEAATHRGLRVRRLPIVDGDTPADAAAFAALIADIAGWAAAGEVVVVHCRGGLGRAGTVGGCVLRLAGLDGEAAVAAVAAVRGPNAPETRAQRAYVRAFAGAPPSRRSRVLGAVLGAAIGDAMGHPTEFVRSFAAIRAAFPPDGVTGYTLWWERDGGRVAPYTDDTQMAEIVLRALVEGRESAADLDAVMQAVAGGFVAWLRDPQGGHRAPGNACLAGCAMLARGVPWREAGAPDAGGCGSVMRAYPFGLVFADDVPRAEAWAVDHSRLTHRDPIALAACAAMAAGMAAAMAGAPAARVCTAMCAAAARHDTDTSLMLRRAVKEGLTGIPPEVTLQRLEGWAAHEAIAAAAYVFARHPDEPRAAILEAANTPGDSDSIATLVGALTGARCGLERLPADWIRDLERSAELQALAERAAEVIREE
jgi:ADP-ribosyl-[dinitrogen reductase] hydrolase